MIVILYIVIIEISAQYIFSCISRMALDAQRYGVSEKNNQNSTKRTNCYLRENLAKKFKMGFQNQNVFRRLPSKT